MKFTKKTLLIGVLCVIALAATLGGFAVANAADNGSAKTETAVANLMDKVAEIYENNTGTAINPVELQKAFTEAGTALGGDRIDLMLQNLVDEGKITQEQADQWKIWCNSRPDQALSSEFKTWMESRPDIPGFFQGGLGKMMPFSMGRGLRGNAPCWGD